MSILSFLEAVRSKVPEGTVSTLIFLLVVLGTVIEITPVKISPLTWIVKKIGNIANKDVLERLDEVERDIKSLKKENKMQDEKRLEWEAIIARREILRFGDGISHGVVYSRDSYAQVLSDIDEYEKYCAMHPDFKNNMTKAATKKILNDFEARDAANDFLK